MGFRAWLLGEEQSGGRVDGTRTDNFCSDDEYHEKIPQSRYRARDRKKVRGGPDPAKMFGFRPRYSRIQ